MNKFIIISGLFIVIGAVLFIWSLYSFLEVIKIKRHGIKTIATITHKEKKKSDTLSGADEFPTIYYSYEVTYTDYNGKIITKTSNFGDQTDLPVGSQIEVIYDKTNTDEFIIFVENQIRFHILMLLMGVTSFIIGIVMLIYKVIM